MDKTCTGTLGIQPIAAEQQGFGLLRNSTTLTENSLTIVSLGKSVVTTLRQVFLLGFCGLSEGSLWSSLMWFCFSPFPGSLEELYESWMCKGRLWQSGSHLELWIWSTWQQVWSLSVLRGRKWKEKNDWIGFKMEGFLSYCWSLDSSLIPKSSLTCFCYCWRVRVNLIHYYIIKVMRTSGEWRTIWLWLCELKFYCVNSVLLYLCIANLFSQSILK